MSSMTGMGIAVGVRPRCPSMNPDAGLEPPKNWLYLLQIRSVYDMRKTVTIKIKIDTDDYEDVGESDLEAVDLAENMVFGEADYPPVIVISCGSVVRVLAQEED